MGTSSLQPCSGALAFSVMGEGTFWFCVTSRQLCDGVWVLLPQTIPAPSSFPSSLTSPFLYHVLCNSQET